MAGKRHSGLFSLSAAACLVLAGCRTPAPAVVAPPAHTPLPRVWTRVGEILHVNPAGGHVVLRCESLPLPGEEGRVFRGDELVARVRISGPERMPFVVAETAEGDPREGDVVKVLREKRTDSAAVDGGDK